MEGLNIVQINRIEGKFYIQNLLTAKEAWMTDCQMIYAKPNVQTREECIGIMYEAVGASTEGANHPELRISNHADRAIRMALDTKVYLRDKLFGYPFSAQSLEEDYSIYQEYLEYKD